MASCYQNFNILKPNISVLQAEEGTGRILIARVMHGGAADRSGLIAVGDEVIEVSVYTTVCTLSFPNSSSETQGHQSIGFIGQFTLFYTVFLVEVPF